MKELVQIDGMFGIDEIEFVLYKSHISNSILRDENHVWEPGVFNWLKAILCPGGVFVDVGAHAGIFSTYAAWAMGKSGLVIAAEPARELSRLCLFNVSGIKHHGHIAVAYVACVGGSDVESVTLAVCKEENDGDNRISKMPERGADGCADGWEFRCVPAKTLDSVFEKATAGHYLKNRPITLKIDAQWAEVDVLKGAHLTLQKVWNGIVEVQEETEEEVRQIIEEYGFKTKTVAGELMFWKSGMAS